jgi:hypothetical protein
MLKERSREIPQSGADEIDPAMNAPRVLGEIRGAADANALLANIDAGAATAAAADPLLAAARQRHRVIGRKAWEQVLAATPQKRAADMIEKATKYLGPDANAAQLDHVANHIQGFARDAADFLTRGDNHGLERAIVAFWSGVRDADKLATPKPPLMPFGDNVIAGWSSAEEIGLRNILLKGLCGVTIGDRCISIDSNGATLASGARISRKQALDNTYVPQGGQMIAVGSLPQMLAVIARAQPLVK